MKERSSIYFKVGYPIQDLNHLEKNRIEWNTHLNDTKKINFSCCVSPVNKKMQVRYVKISENTFEMHVYSSLEYGMPFALRYTGKNLVLQSEITTTEAARDVKFLQ